MDNPSRRTVLIWSSVGAAAIAAPQVVANFSWTQPVSAEPALSVTPAIVYRTDGPWGLGTGYAPLTSAQMDNNFYVLDQRIKALEEKLEKLL